MMKQKQVLRMLFACTLFAVSFATVSAQRSASQGSGSLPGSEQASKKQIYLNQPAAYEQQKLQSHPVTQNKVMVSKGNMSHLSNAGLSEATAPAADRKERLLQLRAAAAARGTSTAKYDLELQKLNH